MTAYMAGKEFDSTIHPNLNSVYMLAPSFCTYVPLQEENQILAVFGSL